MNRGYMSSPAGLDSLVSLIPCDGLVLPTDGPLLASEEADCTVRDALWVASPLEAHLTQERVAHLLNSVLGYALWLRPLRTGSRDSFWFYVANAWQVRVDKELVRQLVLTLVHCHRQFLETAEEMAGTPLSISVRALDEWMKVTEADSDEVEEMMAELDETVSSIMDFSFLSDDGDPTSEADQPDCSRPDDGEQAMGDYWWLEADGGEDDLDSSGDFSDSYEDEEEGEEDADEQGQAAEMKDNASEQPARGGVPDGRDEDKEPTNRAMEGRKHVFRGCPL